MEKETRCFGASRKNLRRTNLNTIVAVISLLLMVSLLSDCAKAATQPRTNPNLDTKEEVTLVVAGQYTDFKALDTFSQKFMKMYPNCTVEYEYMQDYNNLLPKRLDVNPTSVDLFLCGNIQDGSPLLPYALDLYSDERVKLSDVFAGMTRNYEYLGATEHEQLFSLPLGEELRGLFVNTTLLDSLGIAVPINRSELFSACGVLSENGYIPIQANPGNFGQQFVFPYIAHLISDAKEPEAVRDMINSCSEDAAELFRDPLEFLYALNVRNYYNYKYVETAYGAFKDASTDLAALNFLNIMEEGGTYAKKDDIGAVAFMTGINSQKAQIDKRRDDYHSEIEYEFILAPVSDAGGYAYISPSIGIAVNKSTTHKDWAIEFFNQLFKEENNKAFAEVFNVIPNTMDALEYASAKFGIPVDQISQPQDVTFDYGFYTLITSTITNITKSNNPKYMHDDGDGTVSMYDFEYYMDELKNRFVKQRTGGSIAR
jgi:ABC-type glycerol-3-phosphate transport system substrate-binding protein